MLSRAILVTVAVAEIAFYSLAIHGIITQPENKLCVASELTT